MAPRSLRSILWLDEHIGLPNYCRDLKDTFQGDLATSTASFPVTPDPIDELICSIRAFAAPISFTSNILEALAIIEANAIEQRPIIIISSGKLCKQLIPEIHAREIVIHSYYIFCGNIGHHVEWANDYLEAGFEIQMFDFPLTLLIRLARDLADLVIEEGRRVLPSDPVSALNYFECARTLAETAVARDTPMHPNDSHRPSTRHQAVLDGENGLIAQARRASASRTT